jgi:hypothetical protein
MGRVRRASGVDNEEEGRPAEGNEWTLALGAEGPDSGIEDRSEEQVLGGPLKTILTRTEGGAATERRGREWATVAAAVAELGLVRKSYRKGGGEGRRLAGLRRHLSSCRLTLSDRVSPL